MDGIDPMVSGGGSDNDRHSSSATSGPESVWLLIHKHALKNS